MVPGSCLLSVKVHSEVPPRPCSLTRVEEVVCDKALDACHFGRAAEDQAWQPLN